MSKPRLLVVDDEESIRLALDRWFSIRGFEVEQAGDGVEAVARCQAQLFDCVTMDLEMPVMGGEAAIEAIRELHPNMPVVVLTGYPQAIKRTTNDATTKILTKPLRLSELEEHVRQLLVRNSRVQPV